MPNPTAAAVHVNRPLTNVSIAYVQKQDSFVSTKVFPLIRSGKQSDQYFIYNRGDFYRDEAQLRAPATESDGAGYRLTTATFFTDVYAIHKDVDDQIRANADVPIQMDRDATIFVTQLLMLRREIDWATNFFGAGIWGTTLTGVAAGPVAGQFVAWNQAAALPISDILGQIQAIEGRTGFKPNTLVLSADTFYAVKDNADVIDRVKYTQRGVATVDVLASLFEVDRVLIARGVRNAAAEGAAENTGYVMTDGALLCYANPNPSLMMPSAGYSFTWSGFIGSGPDGQRINRIPNPLKASHRIEGEIVFDQRIVDAQLGVFFNNTIV